MFTAAEDFPVITVHVQTRTGSGSKGPTYDAPENVDCFVEYARKLVRNKAGVQVISEATLYSDPQYHAFFTADSLVAFDGQTSTVVKSALHQGIDADVSHIEVNLA